MAEQRFLLIRLGSLGDIIHALPAASSLRDSFADARIDWLVDRKWIRLLEGNPDISNVVPLNRTNPSEVVSTIATLRQARYDCTVDFQSLYKSAILAYASGASRRIGFQSSYAREGLAALFYTDRLNPRGAHKVEHNLTLVESAGAQKSRPRFPLTIRAEDEDLVSGELAANHLDEFFVLNPGGGWRSKCWPAERYGRLHRALIERWGCRGVVTFGPGEEGLVREVMVAAGNPPPVVLPLGLGPLFSLLRRAKFVVSADTGPLHLAAALGVPVVALFGPTDPSRNGPYAQPHAVIRNPRYSNTTYRRGAGDSPAMLSITVEQVFNAVVKRVTSKPEELGEPNGSGPRSERCL